MRDARLDRLAQAEAWDIRERDFPERGTTADKLRFLVGYAVLATSHYNAQPWLFRVRAQEVDLFADCSRALPAADPNGRLLTIACGAALFNLVAAARAFGLATAVEVLPDPTRPDWLARIGVNDQGAPAEGHRLLLAAMTTRRTHRGALDEGEPSPSLLRAVAEAIAAQGARLAFIRTGNLREAVAELVAEAETALQSDAAFREERDRWICDDGSARRDGIPRRYAEDLWGFPGLGMPEWSVEVGAQRTPANHGTRQAALARAGGILALISTDGDTPADWLATGRALKHAVLLARGAGIWAAYHNQPTQLPAFRNRLRELLAEQGQPQILLRLGHGDSPPQIPRRPAAEVLIPS